MTKAKTIPEVSISYEDHLRDLRKRKAKRWAKILAAEAPGRVAGRRRRDPAKEALLLLLDRARLARAKKESAIESVSGTSAEPEL